MKKQLRSAHHPLRSILAASLAAMGADALAQPVFITPPAPAPSSSADASKSAGPDLVGGIPSGSGTPLTWRKLQFRPHVSYDFMYSTGVLIQTNRAEDTFSHTLSPGVAIDFGSHWTMDYTASMKLYSNDGFDNTVNHSATVAGNTQYEDWSFGLNLAAALSNDPQAETGTQTKQQSYSTALDASRQLNGDLSVDLNGAVSFRLTDNFSDSRNYSTLNWINQEFGPNIGAGIGLGFGYDDVGDGVDMTYEQIKARLVCHVTGKIELSVNGGAEIRQFIGSGKSSLLTPIMGAALKYHIFEPTTLTGHADRSVGASYFQNEITEGTTFEAILDQRLFVRYTLSLSGGYALTTYQSSSVDSSKTNRRDDNSFVSVRIGTGFLNRGSISAYYTFTENSSDESGFSYSSNQVGVQVSYSY
ncbi:MAG: hypothetical protein ACTHKU_02275 [Verrucomicrobiota bacterium]